jgi:hypothetical protein
MNLSEMIDLVRKELHDEDSFSYRWTDAELTRHIGRAVKEFSENLPVPVKAMLATTADSKELDISGLTNRVMVEAVEFPVDASPPCYRRFSIWGDTLTIISGPEPDGSICNIYYGALHTLDFENSTIPVRYEDLVVTGACGYAALEAAVYAINRVNTGGAMTPDAFRLWGGERLGIFRERLKRLGRKHRVRDQQLFAAED